jgi:DNA-binding NtrC family response regulator
MTDSSGRSVSEPASKTIAIVDDDPVTRHILRAWLQSDGWQVTEFATGAEALPQASSHAVMCLDLGLDDVSGLELLKRLRATEADLTIVVVTADHQPDTAVSAMRAGAYDYVTKPLDRERLLTALARAFERVTLLRRARHAERGESTEIFAEIVGDSAPIQSLRRQIERVLDSDIAVCVRGESGTGKELVARAVHFNGRRRKAPFVAINCASIPQSLQESELFGHERGAFTGALATHRGRLEQAHGGTLFLDEIGEMSPMTQASLLRALQENVVRRVGGMTDIPINVRVVCATHRDLEAEVAAGRFREDLYFRLVVYPIVVPPLRERLSDVPWLAAHMLHQLREDAQRDVKHISADALEALMGYPWPGNVRELRNIIHRAMVSATSDTIGIADLPAALRDRATPLAMAAQPGAPAPTSHVMRIPTPDEIKPLRELERVAIAQALEACGGNVTQAAKLLGLGRATLYRRLAELQMPASAARTGS